MTNKAPFCAFLWLTITVLSRLITSMISVNPVILSISSSCPSCASWLKNPFNQRNLCPRYPLLINDLRLRKITYEIIKLFLQNEPKFRKSQVNVTAFITSNYVQLDTWSIRKNEPKRSQNEPKRTQNEPNFSPKNDPNEPNTNPNKPNFRK